MKNSLYSITSMEKINEYKVLISNYKEHDLKDTLTLRPYETVAFYK